MISFDDNFEACTRDRSSFQLILLVFRNKKKQIALLVNISKRRRRNLNSKSLIVRSRTEYSSWYALVVYQASYLVERAIKPKYTMPRISLPDMCRTLPKFAISQSEFVSTVLIPCDNKTQRYHGHSAELAMGILARPNSSKYEHSSSKLANLHPEDKFEMFLFAMIDSR